MQFALNYFNVRTMTRCSEKVTATVDRLASVPADMTPNLAIDKQRNRITTLEALEKANQLGQANDLESARKEVTNAIEAIEKSVSGKDPFCKELISGSSLLQCPFESLIMNCRPEQGVARTSESDCLCVRQQDDIFYNSNSWISEIYSHQVCVLPSSLVLTGAAVLHTLHCLRWNKSSCLQLTACKLQLHFFQDLHLQVLLTVSPFFSDTFSSSLLGSKYVAATSHDFKLKKDAVTNFYTFSGLIGK